MPSYERAGCSQVRNGSIPSAITRMHRVQGQPDSQQIADGQAGMLGTHVRGMEPAVAATAHASSSGAPHVSILFALQVSCRYRRTL